jgi:hypothetical protein
MMESMDPGILDSCGGTAGQLRPVQEILDASTVAMFLTSSSKQFQLRKLRAFQAASD